MGEIVGGVDGVDGLCESHGGYWRCLHFGWCHRRVRMWMSRWYLWYPLMCEWRLAVWMRRVMKVSFVG